MMKTKILRGIVNRIVLAALLIFAFAVYLVVVLFHQDGETVG